MEIRIDVNDIKPDYKISIMNDNKGYRLTTPEPIIPQWKDKKTILKEPTQIIQPEQDPTLRELELKLIQQLANGEVSNKVYNDAMGRLQNLNRHPSTEVQGYS